eukprot:6182431-Pleurochrysis_carterae.AAC.5
MLPQGLKLVFVEASELSVRFAVLLLVGCPGLAQHYLHAEETYGRVHTAQRLFYKPVLRALGQSLWNLIVLSGCSYVLAAVRWTLAALTF